MKISEEQGQPRELGAGAVLCALEDIPDGGARLVSCPGGKATESSPGSDTGIVLLRSGRNVFAYWNRCAHFGVPLAKKSQHLIAVPNVSISCNVHYSSYGWQDGRCLTGECKGESLVAVPVAVTIDGKIRLSGPDCC